MRRINGIRPGTGVGILTFFALAGSGLAQGPRLDPNLRVATVNGEAITLGEVDSVIAQRPMALTAPTAGQTRQMRVDVVSALIDELLLRQFLREHGAKIDPALIDKQFALIAAGLKAQKKTLADYLHELNQTEAQARAGMVMLLQLDRYVKDHTTDADMRKYYETNKEHFDRVTVRSSHIVIRLAADASPAERDRARQRLQALRGEIVGGKIDFAKAAMQCSQCPSAPKGGDIGFIQRKFQNVDEAYARAAFALKVGEISDIVETETGLHLIKVTDRTAGTPTKYEQAVDEVRDSYAEELRMSLLNQVRKQAKVSVTLP